MTKSDRDAILGRRARFVTRALAAAGIRPRAVHGVLSLGPVKGASVQPSGPAPTPRESCTRTRSSGPPAMRRSASTAA